MVTPLNDWPNTSSAHPSLSRRCHGTHRPKPSSTAHPEAGALSATLSFSPAPTSSPPSTNTSRPKASKPSATTASTATKPEGNANSQVSSPILQISTLLSTQVSGLRFQVLGTVAIGASAFSTSGAAIHSNAPAAAVKCARSSLSGTPTKSAASLNALACGNPLF